MPPLKATCCRIPDDHRDRCRRQHACKVRIWWDVPLESSHQGSCKCAERVTFVCGCWLLDRHAGVSRLPGSAVLMGCSRL